MKRHSIKLTRQQAEVLTWELQYAIIVARARTIQDKMFATLLALAVERLSEKQPQFLPRDAKPSIKVSFDKAQSIALLYAYRLGLIGNHPITSAMLIEQLEAVDRELA